MKVQTIKSAIMDKYGYNYIYKTTTKLNKHKQTSSIVVSCNNQPMYKATTDGKTTRVFDMGLFGNWILRK